MALEAKNLPARGGDIRDTSSIPGSGRSPGEGNGNRSSILAWKIPWTEEPAELQSIGLQRVGHKRGDLAHTCTLLWRAGLCFGREMISLRTLVRHSGSPASAQTRCAVRACQDNPGGRLLGRQCVWAVWGAGTLQKSQVLGAGEVSWPDSPPVPEEMV